MQHSGVEKIHIVAAAGMIRLTMKRKTRMKTSGTKTRKTISLMPGMKKTKTTTKITKIMTTKMKKKTMITGVHTPDAAKIIMKNRKAVMASGAAAMAANVNMMKTGAVHAAPPAVHAASVPAVSVRGARVLAASVLEVAGDSMINAGILDGDTVIIQQSDTANTGDIVVALLDDSEATLKRLRRRGDSIALEAANPAYETRLYGSDRVKVQGKLVGLIRRY